MTDCCPCFGHKYDLSSRDRALSLLQPHRYCSGVLANGTSRSPPTYLLTYVFTPWCRVPLEKLTGFQLVKKFPAFHGPRRFITERTNVRDLSLSWASPIQSTYPHPTSWISILILSTHLHLGLPSGLRYKIICLK